MGLLAMFFTGKAKAMECKVTEEEDGGLKDVVIRAIKVYVFVMALLLLGGGMKVVIDKYVLGISPEILYWVNMVSAILDNATLTAAEISPAMSMVQIQAVLMGLLIAGGMLIPGNIPNIISAGKTGHLQQGMGQAGRSPGTRADGDILRVDLLHTLPH